MGTDLTLEEWKAKQPDDAVCKAPEWRIWEECPSGCPYNKGEKCTLMGDKRYD